MNGYLLDTNVVSELRKEARCNAGVRAWKLRHRTHLFLSIVSVAELQRGIFLLARRDSEQAGTLSAWLEDLIEEFHGEGSLLPVGIKEAAEWGRLMAIRPLPAMDCLLAATAAVRKLIFVTRNVRDFAGLGLRLENPFQ